MPSDQNERSLIGQIGEPQSDVPRRGQRIPVDLLINLVFLALAVAAVLLEAQAGLRVPLGIALVLFLPGHALICALFPSTDGPDGVARAAMSVALSLAIVPLVALAVDRSPWPIEKTSMSIGLAIVAVISLLLSAILRMRLPADERYVLEVGASAIPGPRVWSREHRIVVGLVVVAVLLFVVGGYQGAKSRLIGEPLTEFALYNEDGEAQFYPRLVTVGQPVSVQIAVTNHEGKPVEYRLTVAGSGVAIDVLPPIVLAEGETWQNLVRFTVVEAGERQPVRFELYRLDQSAEKGPYRELELIVDGVQSGEDASQ